ncbi:hypothetical protein [Kitasatospora sp. NPDC086791]|uniref:hypothetical protein n=1 Tax=Kitasatospora sp. NPDC086791 TaxID=3155178 RepID=UPI0034395D1D
MGNSGVSESRLFLTPAAKALYLRVLTAEEPSPPPSPEREQLLGVGLIAPHPHREAEYVALDVQETVRDWQGNLQAMASQLLLEAQSVPSQLRDLLTAWQRVHPSRPGVGVEYVTGYEAINRALTPLLDSCQKELLTAQPTGPRPAEMLALSYQRDLAVLGRGARMRTIYLPSVRSDGPTCRWAQTVTEQGAQVRTSVDFNRAIIIDRRVAVVSVLTPWEGDGRAPDRAMFVTDEGLVALFGSIFERDWVRAQIWDGSRQDAPRLTDGHQRILVGLSQGKEYDEIAEELAISKRTVASRVAELRSLTGSANVVQLVYWWARNGG